MAISVDLRAELLRLVPDEQRVTTVESELIRHGEDLSSNPNSRPDVVVFAESTAEVRAVLAWANEQLVPVIPFGTGTSLEGHVIPTSGGISLDVSRMNRILAVHEADLQATVQAGVTHLQLNEAIGPRGLQFPVDPGADASLGGMTATNASGTSAVRYGNMRRNVLALEVVLADGTVIRPGSRAVKSSAGYDLTHLFIGSEGTLGVITEVTLRLYGIPEHVVVARCAFPDVDSACRAAATMVAAGVTASRLELVDGQTLREVNAYKGTAIPEVPTLFVEIGGTEDGVEGDLLTAREIAESEGATAFEADSDPTNRARLWQARHEALFATQHAHPGKLHKSTDVCVPVSELPGAIRNAREAIERHGFEVAVVGHVGDGNYHSIFSIDPDSPGEKARAEAANDEIVEYALSVGGTCTGEHGIGIGKMRYLEAEHGDLLPLMRGIKQLLDPHGILNPGKVIANA